MELKTTREQLNSIKKPLSIINLNGLNYPIKSIKQLAEKIKNNTPKYMLPIGDPFQLQGYT